MWAIAGGALVLRLLIASRDLIVLDRMFFFDDAYYTLAIGRSLARGLGPTADGIHLTSGFQPLLAFLLVPVHAITTNPYVAVRAALILLAICDTFVVVLLGRLAWRAGGAVAAVVAAALWAASPVAIGNALGALETSLALVLELALVEACCWARQIDGRTDRQGDASLRWLLCGAIAGLALLARIDAVFVVLGCASVLLVVGTRRALAPAAAGAAAVVAPWWLYCLATFGSVIPESGRAVRELVVVYKEYGLALPVQLGWAAGNVMGATTGRNGTLRLHLAFHPPQASAAWWALALCLAVLGLRLFARRDERAPILAVPLHGLSVLVFYTYVLAVPWFYERYLAPAQVAFVLVLAVAAGQAWRLAPRARLLSWPVRLGIAGATACVVLLGLQVSGRYVTWAPEETIDQGLGGARGYREPVQHMLAVAPDDAVIASLQSGALTYFARPGQTVVNLDGVVDGEAARAFRERQLGAFARQRGVTHIIDWEYNLGNFLRLSNDPALGFEAFELMGRGKAQGDNQFVLARLVWPEPGYRARYKPAPVDLLHAEP